MHVYSSTTTGKEERTVFCRPLRKVLLLLFVVVVVHLSSKRRAVNTPLTIKRTKKSVSTIVAADLLSSSRSLDVIVLFRVFFVIIFSVSPLSSLSSIDLGSSTHGSRIALKGSRPFLRRRGLLFVLSGDEDDDEDDEHEAITLLPKRDEECFVAIEAFFFREEDKEEEELEHADE